jgi:hypothetical protein
MNIRRFVYAALVLLVVAACGTSTPTSSSSASAVTATTPSASNFATSEQLIAVAQKVYGKGQFSVCDFAADYFKNCPFTASLNQKMIHKAATQPGPDPLGAGDGPGLRGAVAYSATVSATGGSVVATVGTDWSATLTIVSVNGHLLVDGLAINGVPVT